MWIILNSDVLLNFLGLEILLEKFFKKSQNIIDVICWTILTNNPANKNKKITSKAWPDYVIIFFKRQICLSMLIYLILKQQHQWKISYLTCWRNLLFLTYITIGTTIWIVISFRWSSIWAFSSVVKFNPLSKSFIITNEELTNSVMISKVKYPYIPQTGRFQRWVLKLINVGWSALPAVGVKIRNLIVDFKTGSTWRRVGQ